MKEEEEDKKKKGKKKMKNLNGCLGYMLNGARRSEGQGEGGLQKGT